MDSYEQSNTEQIIEQLNQEHDQVKAELNELEVLIRQSSAEVEKLAGRNAQLMTKVRNMEANFDTIPRDDIRATYKAAQDTQGRLFMMQGQAERMNNKKENLTRYFTTLAKILEISGGLADLANTYDDMDDGSAKLETDVGVVKIIDAQESERRTLANQLHDGPAQALTNLILQAEICERLFDSDPSRARNELTTLKDSVTQTFQKVREFIFELRPMMLDDLGLTPTLKKLFEDFEEKYNLPINFRVTGQDSRIPAHAEVTVFRVVQQLIKNVHQHASANQIQISLDIGSDRATTIVEDDGAGFDVESALEASRQRKTMGLATIYERVEMLGGEVICESSTGQGTRLEFWILTE